MLTSDWTQLQAHILQLEQQELVTRTFRRLDPPRQQAILQAILDEAAEKGPTDVNIKEVARRAGVSVGSLYQYFGSRETLLAFAVELGVRMMTDLFAISVGYAPTRGTDRLPDLRLGVEPHPARLRPFLRACSLPGRSADGRKSCPTGGDSYAYDCAEHAVRGCPARRTTPRPGC